MVDEHAAADPLDAAAPGRRRPTVRAVIEAVRRVHVGPEVRQYCVELVAATRRLPELRLGASPRATLQLVRAARAQAALSGRGFVVPDDVQAVAVPVLAHRLLLAPDARAARRSAADLVRGLLARLPVRRRPGPSGPGPDRRTPCGSGVARRPGLRPRWAAAGCAGLTTRGRCLLAGGSATAVCAVLLDERDLLRIGAFVAVLPLLALLLALATRRAVRVHADALAAPAAGRRRRRRSRCRSLRGGALLGALRLVDTVPDAAGPSAAPPRFLVPRAAPGRGRGRHYPLRPRLRGVHRIGPLVAYGTDPLGLAEFARTSPAAPTGCWCCPGSSRCTGCPPRSARGEGTPGAALAHQGQGSSDVLVRPYRSGDELRRVHWRSTARHDELMVRLEERPWRGGITVLLDRRDAAHRGHGAGREPGVRGQLGGQRLRAPDRARRTRDARHRGRRQPASPGSAAARTRAARRARRAAPLRPGPTSAGPALAGPGDLLAVLGATATGRARRRCSHAPPAGHAVLLDTATWDAGAAPVSTPGRPAAPSRRRPPRCAARAGAVAVATARRRPERRLGRAVPSRRRRPARRDRARRPHRSARTPARSRIRRDRPGRARSAPGWRCCSRAPRSARSCRAPAGSATRRAPSRVVVAVGLLLHRDRRRSSSRRQCVAAGRAAHRPCSPDDGVLGCCPGPPPSASSPRWSRGAASRSSTGIAPVPATPEILLLVTRRVRGARRSRCTGRGRGRGAGRRRACRCWPCSPSRPRSPTSCCPGGRWSRRRRVRRAARAARRRPDRQRLGRVRARRGRGRGGPAASGAAAGVVGTAGRFDARRSAAPAPADRSGSARSPRCAASSTGAHPPSCSGARAAPARLPAGADAERLRAGRRLAGQPARARASPLPGPAAAARARPPGERATVEVENVGFRDYWLPLYGDADRGGRAGRPAWTYDPRSGTAYTRPAPAGGGWQQRRCCPRRPPSSCAAADGAHRRRPGLPRHRPASTAGSPTSPGRSRADADDRLRPGDGAAATTSPGRARRSATACRPRPGNGDDALVEFLTDGPSRLLRAVRLGDGGDAARGRRAGPGGGRVHRRARDAATTARSAPPTRTPGWRRGSPASAGRPSTRRRSPTAGRSCRPTSRRPGRGDRLGPDRRAGRGPRRRAPRGDRPAPEAGRRSRRPRTAPARPGAPGAGRPAVAAGAGWSLVAAGRGGAAARPRCGPATRRRRLAAAGAGGAGRGRGGLGRAAGRVGRPRGARRPATRHRARTAAAAWCASTGSTREAQQACARWSGSVEASWYGGVAPGTRSARRAGRARFRGAAPPQPALAARAAAARLGARPAARPHGPGRRDRPADRHRRRRRGDPD